MSEFLTRLIAFTALAIVVALIAQLVRYWVTKADLRGLPHPADRSRILRQLRIRRQQRQSHTECMQYLLSQGLRRGVASRLLIDLERADPADLVKRNAFIWNGWCCVYPGNWQESALNPALDRDVAASINALGGASITFFKTAEGIHKQVLDTMTRDLQQPTEVAFGQWAGIPGQGRILRGRHRKLRLPIEIMSFKFTANDEQPCVLRYYVEEQRDLIIAGFELIESSFRREAGSPRALIEPRPSQK